MSNLRIELKRKSFTLIELLVAVSIIAILMSLLIPVLGRAKRQAIRVQCMSNQRQCTLANFNYADENDSWLFLNHRDATQGPNNYKVGSGYDLRTYLQNYLDPKLWWCPEMVYAKYINGPGNTGSTLFSTFLYFPGNPRPNFGGAGMPSKLTRIDEASNMALMQDNMKVQDGVGVLYNHGRGRPTQYTTDCSAYWRYSSITLQEVDGANITFYDGHVEWLNPRQLEDVGLQGSADPWRIYSRMP